jgi:hypothetical protein
MNMVFRGFRSGVLLFEQHASLDAPDLDDLVPKLAAEHLAFLAGPEPWMIEIEFLDEPYLGERFFRIGADGTLMREPVRLQ